LVFSPFYFDYDQFPLIIMTVIYLTREGMALEIRLSCLYSYNSPRSVFIRGKCFCQFQIHILFGYILHT